MAGIIELKVNNFKRISAVELSFAEDKATTIAGRNGQGKSSVLDAIIAAMCGKGSIEEVPVKVGENEATIVCTVSTDPPLKIVRKIKPDGRSTLTLTQKTGKIESKVSKPQQTLDGLLGRISFDPLEFTRMKPADQIDLLKELVGVDTASIDHSIEQEMEHRKFLKREVDELKSHISRLEYYDDAPKEEVSVSELMDQLEEANRANESRRERVEHQLQVRSAIEDRENEIKHLLERIESLKVEIGGLKAEDEKIEDSLKGTEVIDTQPLRNQISQADEVNRKVRSNREIEEVQGRLKQKENAVESQTKSIEDLRSRKLKMMGEAKWPVDGLGFSATGVTFNGLPFSQCSSAEQLKISTAIGLSQNPEIRLMMIRDGSLLDDDSMRTMNQLAKEHDAQILIERVGTGQQDEIVIEDGTVYQPKAEPVA